MNGEIKGEKEDEYKSTTSSGIAGMQLDVNWRCGWKRKKPKTNHKKEKEKDGTLAIWFRYSLEIKNIFGFVSVKLSEWWFSNFISMSYTIRARVLCRILKST